MISENGLGRRLTARASCRPGALGNLVFGEDAQEQLNETLGIVGDTAEELGIALNGDVKAMLDAHSVSFSGGTISLQSESHPVEFRKVELKKLKE